MLGIVSVSTAVYHPGRFSTNALQRKGKDCANKPCISVELGYFLAFGPGSLRKLADTCLFLNWELEHIPSVPGTLNSWQVSLSGALPHRRGFVGKQDRC